MTPRVKRMTGDSTRPAGGRPLALERVQLMTHPANEASAAVLRSLGFTNEGLLRAFRAEPAGREDRLMWSMLPIDWKAS